MPIIVVSARRARWTGDGLELGAEDYVAKPSAWRASGSRAGRLRPRPRAVEPRDEVRVRGRERRRGGANGDRDGEAVEMTATEFDAPALLIEAARGARREASSRACGARIHGTPRTIDNFIQQLRAKLERDPQRPATSDGPRRGLSLRRVIPFDDGALRLGLIPRGDERDDRSASSSRRSPRRWGARSTCIMPRTTRGADGARAALVDLRVAPAARRGAGRARAARRANRRRRRYATPSLPDGAGGAACLALRTLHDLRGPRGVGRLARARAGTWCCERRWRSPA